MLPKSFAVKKISLAHSDEETILEIQRSFRRELATLKRFRHPNIIALYGYNLRVNHTQQFLLYEYAAFGALDGFLRDDGNRARLPADVRLSIMYELTRAVHFLHTGGCKGFIVCHRDIKSANICLTEDFTARIIDCGLAKFVCEDEKALPGSVTPSVRNSSGGNAFGTPGYICPMYARGGCSFMAACDVYSIGVVMVELILGCLNGGQSTRNGTQFSNVFERYIKDKFDEPVKDGWKQLIQDADPSILWNSDSLEVVCETAIACMASSPYKRLSTHDLLPRLSTAITLNTKANAKSNSGTKTANVPACVESSVRSGVCCACAICNQNLSCIKCSKGHALCQYCTENSVLRDIVGGRRARCAIKMCSSIPFEFEELCGHVSVEVYNQYVVERTTRSVFDSCLRRIEAKVESLKVTVDGMKVGVDKTQQLMQSQQRMLQKLGKGLDRSLAVLALLAANLFRECPNLIWLTPISVNATNPMQWIKKTGMHKYSVVFVCAYSLEPGHVPFEIEVPKGWIAKIAPVLQLSLMALKGAASSFGFPFPLPNLTFLQQSELMTHFLDTVAEESALGTLTSCQTLVENGILDNDYGELQTLMGPAFQMIAEKAKGVQNWKPPQMVPVCDQNGTPIWIKGVHQGAFR
ncbi:serine/threonine kinase [Fragilaria crotonensis]|nr:serine/threonine kinase [Fragilaria crotonensis]